MELLQANEVYEEIIDGCFLNIWFVNSWDDMKLFVLNREVKQKEGEIVGYIHAYSTEYDDPGKSCGSSIINIKFEDDGVLFEFNEIGKKFLKTDALKIIYPPNFENKTNIEKRILELVNSKDYSE